MAPVKRFNQMTAALLSLCGCISGSVNSPVAPPAQLTSPHFPTVTVADLEGKSYVLPTELRSDWTLLVIAFYGSQQGDVDTWLAQFPALKVSWPELDFVEMPTIEQSSAPFRSFVNNGMRSGIKAPEARQRTQTLYTDRVSFLAHLGVSDMSRIYPLLVRRSGEVKWMNTGPATSENVGQLLTLLKTITPSQSEAPTSR